MAVIEKDQLSKRWYYECDEFGRCRNATWSDWGRWVALVVILLSLFLLFLGCSIISARRRKRAGLRPLYGTAWVIPKNFGNHNQQYHSQQPSQFHYDSTAQYNPYSQPAPPYSPPAAGYFSPPPPTQQYEMNGYSQQGQQQGPYNQESGTTQPYYAPPAGNPDSNQNQNHFPPPPPAHTQARDKA